MKLTAQWIQWEAGCWALPLKERNSLYAGQRHPEDGGRFFWSLSLTGPQQEAPTLEIAQAAAFRHRQSEPIEWEVEQQPDGMFKVLRRL